MDNIFRNLDGFEIIAPNVVGAGVSEDIIFTNKAMEKLVQEINDNYTFIDEKKASKLYFVRLIVKSTPTHAKKYSIEIDSKIDKFDRVFDLRKINIVVDRKSLFYYMGILIDYVQDGSANGFIFLEHENYVIDNE